jgi:C-terminal processing protease CtpA/Prc
MRSLNYGFERAERLPGNIGYLDLRAFMDAREGGATAAAAMAFLANTNALIVDIRRNGGGGPEMVALVSSYLFDERVHLNSLYWREGDRTDQFWTTDWVPGPRFGGSRPVYVLTSGETFSAAEEFAYNLQTRKRATIVGETTGGGAHPGGPARLTEHFRLFIPRGRAINPVTGDNWEGRGVKPDVPVPATDALRTARVLAMRERLSQVKDAELKGELERLLRELEAEVTPRPTRGNGG